MAQERTPLTRRCLSGQDQGTIKATEDSRVLVFVCVGSVKKVSPSTMVLALVHDMVALQPF